MTEKATGRAGGGTVVRGGQPSGRKPGRVQRLSIKEARDSISKLVERLGADSSGAYIVGRREAPTALLVSFARFEPLLGDDPGRKLAFLVVDQLMGDAPLHLRRPQLDELSVLPKADLVLLLGVEKLPLSKVRQAELERKLSNAEALRRLLRRSEIARSIRRAREDGLYEAAEHLASSDSVLGDEDRAEVLAANAAE